MVKRHEAHFINMFRTSAQLVIGVDALRLGDHAQLSRWAWHDMHMLQRPTLKAIYPFGIVADVGDSIWIPVYGDVRAYRIAPRERERKPRKRYPAAVPNDVMLALDPKATATDFPVG